MARKFGSKGDLPDWFSLEKYAGFAELTPGEWATQLKARVEIDESFREGTREYANRSFHKRVFEHICFEPKLKKDYAELADRWGRGKQSGDSIDDNCKNEQLCKKIKDQTADYDRRMKAWISDSLSLPDIDRNTTIVRPLEALETIVMGHKLTEHIGSKNEWLFNVPFMQSFDMYSKHNRLSKKTKKEKDGKTWNPRPQRIHLSVDLESSDEDIMREFQVCLKAYRKAFAIPQPEKRITDNIIEKLSQYQIIPYIDLTIWQKMNSKKIQKSILARALYPEGEAGDKDLIDGKVARLLNRATKPAFIKSLWSMERVN